MISQTELKELLTYDPETGWFTRNKDSPNKRHKKGARMGATLKRLSYRHIKINGRYIKETFIAYLYMTGSVPAVNSILHINKDTFDSSWGNLKIIDKTRDLTAAELRDKYNYNKDTGVLTYKKNGRPVGSIHKDRKGCTYLQVSIRRKSYLVHRVIWFLVVGDWPKKTIDHINGVGVDNRWTNLRDVSQKDNAKNRGIQKNNKSGTPGVFYESRSEKWKVFVQSDGEKYWFGSYDTLEEAVSIRKEKEKLFDFHENHNDKRRNVCQ